MNFRPISRRLAAMPVSEGAGVEVRRSIGLPALRHLDPFLMLDHFSSDDPDDYIAGFPDHPHRGFVTLTYMLDGHMLHRDRMGNRGDLKSGGAQWMKAASGVIHSEMPQQTNGLMRGFQLWINLPAREKMSDPGYQNIEPESIPVVAADGATVRVLSGSFGGQRGPITDPITDLRYLDIGIAPGQALEVPVEPDRAAFVYVFEGGVQVAGTGLPTHHFAALGDGDAVRLTADGTGARLILVSARPLGEPIVQYGPFVMNTREEIEQAFADYRDNRLVREPARVVNL